MKDNLMIGVTRVVESPYHDDIGEADMTVKHQEIERFVRIHGKYKAKAKIRKQFETALDAAFRQTEGCAHAEVGLCEECQLEVGKF
ncbi:MAG: hypothetical protein AB2777_20625 [Candidatus Thiodiazotropha endolucinida]